MRVDDGDNERIYQEARAQDRKTQQLQGERRTDEATAFDRALAGRSPQQQRAAAGQPAKPSLSRSALQRAISTQKDTKGRNKPSRAESSSEQVQADAAQAEGHVDAERVTERGGQDRDVSSKADQGKSADARQAAGQQSRSAGQTKLRDGQTAARLKDSQSEARAESGRAGDLLRADGEATPETSKKVGGSRSKGDDGGSGQGQSQQQPESFRLPPQALMAPPPLARPKETAAPSRLRSLAQEIADKIVKQVHIGTNRMGLAEFQLELKSDILKGLKVKVAGRHGRIRATFSSRDLQVIKQLKGEIGRLREALTARGLKVDALDVEEDRT